MNEKIKNNHNCFLINNKEKRISLKLNQLSTSCPPKNISFLFL